MREIRSIHPGTPISMMSHGDELITLSYARLKDYSSMHELLSKLVIEENLRSHIYGTMAEMNDFSPDNFPPYFYVTPFGSSQVEDYLKPGYVMIDLELTW